MAGCRAGWWVRCSSVQLIIAQALGESKSPKTRLCGWNATKCGSDYCSGWNNASEKVIIVALFSPYRRSSRRENDSSPAELTRGVAKIMHKEPVEKVSNGHIAKRLLNVREAAQYLGIEVDTVYKKSRLREVPCVKVGRSLRFDVKALERYIEQHSIETID